jgi:hypothetical protein
VPFHRRSGQCRGEESQDDAVEVGGRGPYGDEHVHVGTAVPQGRVGPPIETGPGPELHRRGQREQEVKPPLTPHVEHRQNHDRQGQRPAQQERDSQGTFPGGSHCPRGLRGQLGLVTQFPHHRCQGRRCGGPGKVLDRGLLCRQIDLR